MSTQEEAQKNWDSYCIAEITKIQSILNIHHIILDDMQPHIKGERYLMQAVTTTSGRKLILLGRDENNMRVVVKATCDTSGKKELTHERHCREILKKMDFAGAVFHTPAEVAFIEQAGYTISITAFIEQESTFIERPLNKQFNLALRAFKAQESAHATTFKHRKLIESVFEIRDAETYLKNFLTFKDNITYALPEEHTMHALLSDVFKGLNEHKVYIEQYSGFLTHTDFVPHNIRVKDDTIYLLDHSSLTFGNKYEGWARFLNFMTLYNPDLEQALIVYVRDNRTKEESIALQMMRMYRLGEIIWYYVRTLDKSTENLLLLNTARIYFWTSVLSYISKGERVPIEVIRQYTETRDKLRSEDEKRRQQGLH